MKKALERDMFGLYYYRYGARVAGANPQMHGDCSRLWGDCSDLQGDCSDVWGDCTGIMGNIDNCELTVEGREKGVDIRDLVI